MNRAARLTSLGVAAIVLATVAAYIPALRGGFVWDDEYHVTENRTLRSLNGLGRIWFDVGATPQYYPLAFTSFWLEYSLWGAEPFGYHLVNVLLHALNAVLLWFVLRRLSLPGAWCAAAIFALHPVQVESVAWITERKNVLSGAFYLSALLTYLRFAHIGSERLSGARPWGWYGIALVLFTAALLSKTVTCSLPAVILLLLWWKRKRLDVRTVLPLVPLFAVGLALGLPTVWLEKHHIQAQGVEWAFSSTDRWLIAGRALWFYLGKLLWPASLTFIYPRWPIDAGQWWQYVYPLAFAALAVCLWFVRRRIGKAPLVTVLIFAGTLLPALGFVNVYPMRYSFVADHFQYLAGIAPLALLTALAASAPGRLRQWLSRREPPPGRDRLTMGVQSLTAAVVLLTLATLTWQQGHIYRDREALWRDTLANNPSAWIAHLNLGRALEQQGRLAEAIPYWMEAARFGPDAYKAHHNLGRVLGRLGRPDEAIAHYRQSMALNPQAPEPFNNLAWLLATHPDPAVRDGPEAVRLAEYAARLSGHRHPVILGTLAAAYAEVGRFADAVMTARRALTQIRDPYDTSLIEQTEAQLKLYELRRPYREP